MVRLLDDSEIDDWFTEEKTRIAERMTVALEKGADMEKERRRFDHDYWKLHARYERLYRQAAAYNARQERIALPLRRFRHWRRERLEALRLRWRLLLESFRRWRFNLRYQWVFHQRKRKI